MAQKPPLTCQLIDCLSDGRREAQGLFLADGVIDPREAYVLATMDDSLLLAEQTDLGRKRAIKELNAGELGEWDARQLRELEQATARREHARTV